MNENQFKSIVKAILKELGLIANDIPRKNSKTPDFDVSGQNSKYTIELKIKSDDPEERKRELKTLAKGEIVSKSIPIGPRNRLYGIIKEGIEQMAEYDPQHNTFHVIWLHSIGKDASMLNDRFRATLFGTQKLFTLGRNGLITCYYFNESIFYSCRNTLDGAILTYNDNAQLCVNTLSPWLKEFQKSDLYKSLSQGLCDPEILQNSEGVMIADYDIGRKDSNQVIQYLREKYKLEHLQTIDMEKHSAIMALPKEDK